MFESAEMGETFLGCLHALGVEFALRPIVLEDGQGIGCFGEYLPGDAVTKWSNGEWTQLAFEAEVLPIFFA